MKQSVFVIRLFKNRNGAHSGRVQGRLNGVRIRRNFKTQEEAAVIFFYVYTKGGPRGPVAPARRRPEKKIPRPLPSP